MPTITTATTIVLRANSYATVTARSGATATAAFSPPGLVARSLSIVPLAPYVVGPFTQDVSVLITPSGGTVQYDLTYPTVPSQPVLPPTYAWANRPAANSVPLGTMVFMSDIGENGRLFQSNGTRWLPSSSTARLAKLGAPVSGITNTAQIVLRALLPANAWQTNDTIGVHLMMGKSGTTDTGLVTVYIGTTGTTSDTAVTGLSALAVMIAANRSGGFDYEIKLLSATSAQRMGTIIATGAGSTAGATTSSVPSATTITDASANPLYISVAIASGGATDTISVQDAHIRLETP